MTSILWLTIALSYGPWFYYLDVFSKLKVTLLSYLPVNIVKTSIMSPFIGRYLKVGSCSSSLQEAAPAALHSRVHVKDHSAPGLHSVS